MAEQTNFCGDPNWNLVPEHTRESIRLYVERHLHPGRFVYAVMCNDLMGASRHADDINRPKLADIAKFVFHYCSGDCCGDPKIVHDWLNQNHEKIAG